MDAQVIPPSDWIDFYPPSANRLAALSVLKREQITRAEHTALNFPFAFGRATQQARETLAPNPALNFMYKNDISVDLNQSNFGETAAKLVNGDRYTTTGFRGEKIPEPAEKEKVMIQVGIVESLLRYTRPFFNSRDRLCVTFDFDNGLVGPGHIRSRDWHTDNTGDPLNVMQAAGNQPIPGIVCMMRTYAPTDFMRGEWRQSGDELLLHPKAKAVIDAEKELELALCERKWRSRELTQEHFKLQARIDRLTEKARRKGLVVQMRPYEFTLVSTNTPHRTHNPRQNPLQRLFRGPLKAVPSSFLRLVVERHNPEPRP